MNNYIYVVWRLNQNQCQYIIRVMYLQRIRTENKLYLSFAEASIPLLGLYLLDSVYTEVLILKQDQQLNILVEEEYFELTSNIADQQNYPGRRADQAPPVNLKTNGNVFLQRVLNEQRAHKNRFVFPNNISTLIYLTAFFIDKV